MLALITYKNIFPRDFSELQLNRGFVYELFESKSKIIAEKKSRLLTELAGLQELLGQAGNAFLTGSEIDSLINTEYFNYNGYRIQFPKEVKSKLDDAKTFYEAKTKFEKEKLNEKITKLEKQIALLDNSKLCDLLSRDSIDSIFFGNCHLDGNQGVANFEEIKGSSYFDLLKFLLRNGHIDESYADYMTYFYPESITKNDKAFLRSVADKRARDWSYGLDDPDKVIGRLSQADFTQPEVLNFQLLNFLIRTGKKRDSFTRVLLHQLEEVKSVTFVNDYLLQEDLGEVGWKFINELNVCWPAFFGVACGDSAFDPANRILWAQVSLCVSSGDIIERINGEDCLCDFIADTPDFLCGKIINYAKLIEGMALLGVEMKRIDPKPSDKELLKLIYERDLYVLNAGNVVVMLSVFYGIAEVEVLWSRGYSLVMAYGDSPLGKRVLGHMDEFLGLVFENCGGRIDDAEEYVLEVLNKKTVSKEVKSRYVSLLATVLGDLSGVEDAGLWDDLLQRKRVACSPENILSYFEAKDRSIDNVLVAFINSGEEDGLGFSDGSLFEDDEKKGAFFRSIVRCSDIENAKYERILSGLNRIYDKFEIMDIKVEKALILIKIGAIGMSVESFSTIKENYASALMEFIHTNFDDFLGLPAVTFDADLVDEILNSPLLDDVEKISLLDKISFEISIQELECSDAVVVHILSHRFDRYDIDYLIEEYDHFSPDVQAQAIKVLTSSHAVLIDKKCALPLSLLMELIQEETLSPEVKVWLFVNSLGLITDATVCQECLRVLGLSELGRVLTGGRPKISNTEVNGSILSVFKEKGWIRDFVPDAENGVFLKVTKQKLPSESGD
ncbi:hypothetical protein OH491_16450 [Termitidicoccus mucosus]|uniref:hypothetical protein n=1 Tax=Termitidicoccus mucosus TaxID=1184151 RepID=UPI0032439F20